MPLKRSILIVDDDAGVRTAYKCLFEQAGWAVHLAKDGTNLRSAIGRKRLDVILIDIFMPAMDGIEVLRDLRPRLPQIPIIMMTGGGSFGNYDILDASLKLGADAIYSKLSPVGELVHLAQTCSDKRHAAMSRP